MTTPTTPPVKAPKLRPADVPAIGDAYRAGESMRRIGARLGVCEHTISDVLTGRTWAHVPGGVAEVRPSGRPRKEGPILPRPGHARGERVGSAKLRPADVPAIGDAYRAGESMERVAARFGVSKSTVYRALTGAAWSHVPGGVVADRRPARKPRKEGPERVKAGQLRGGSHPGAKLTDAKVAGCRASYRDGIPGAYIARTLGLAQSTVSSMLTGRTWAHVPGAVAVDSRRGRPKSAAPENGQGFGPDSSV